MSTAPGRPRLRRLQWFRSPTVPTVRLTYHGVIGQPAIGAQGTADVFFTSNVNGTYTFRIGASDCATGTVVDSGTVMAQRWAESRHP